MLDETLVVIAVAFTLAATVRGILDGGLFLMALRQVDGKSVGFGDMFQVGQFIAPLMQAASSWCWARPSSF